MKKVHLKNIYLIQLLEHVFFIHIGASNNIYLFSHSFCYFGKQSQMLLIVSRIWDDLDEMVKQLEYFSFQHVLHYLHSMCNWLI